MLKDHTYISQSKLYRRLIKIKQVIPLYIVWGFQFLVFFSLVIFIYFVASSDTAWGLGARTLLLTIFLFFILSISVHKLKKRVNQRSIEEELRRREVFERSLLYAPISYFKDKIKWQNLDSIASSVLSRISLLAPLVYLVYIFIEDFDMGSLIFVDAMFASSVVFYTYISLVLISIATIGNSIFCPRPVKMYKSLSDYCYGEKPVIELQRALINVKDNTSYLAKNGMFGLKVNVPVRRSIALLVARSHGSLQEEQLLEVVMWEHISQSNGLARFAIFTLFACGYFFFFSVMIGRLIGMMVS